MLNTTWRIIGRLLISLIIFNTAVEKLQFSQIYRMDFNKSIEHIQIYGQSLGLTLPNLKTYTLWIIKASGLLDAFMGVLILLGDSRGGLLAVGRFIVGLITYYLPWSIKHISSYAQRQRLGNAIGLLGIAMILTRRN